ncbi:RNA polymerase sigma-70 factor [uncultured Sunxiuqinia sp.]|uniref:RNA polymerase sigma-70 factor n=1 Tax=uncultured Sunxiuqinia sp. TaxID=1573825 RepID=UPI002AA5F38F|nr:RNA polymerase sigma-70 factor [uncultured Sunxiuqinia sp.]
MTTESKHIDKNLLRKLKDGDRYAFQVIFDAYSERLFHFAYSYLKDSNNSEEIVQDVFLRLWEIKAEIDEDKSFKSFLYKMTVNRVFNHLKHQIVRQKYEEHLMNLTPAYSDTPEEELRSKELSDKVQEVLIKLPEQKRRIFILSRLKGYSNAEISEELGLSVRTVENQIYRATKFLKEHLKDDFLLLLGCCLFLF